MITFTKVIIVKNKIFDQSQPQKKPTDHKK